jgi:thiamine-phosphate diphosphorylase
VAASPSPRNPLAGRPASGWPALHAIIDVDVCTRAGWTPARYASALLDGGATFLQIRAKQLESGAFLELCDRIVAAAEAYDATVIVNDRVDLARLSGAAGVHVGQEDLPVAAVRQLLDEQAIVGF